MGGSAAPRLLLRLHGRRPGEARIEHERMETVLGAKGIDLGQRRVRIEGCTGRAA
jgi:hypothetical protein